MVYADEPAYGHLRHLDPPPGRFELAATKPPSANQAAQLVAAARRIIETENPHALLVGVSHCGEAGLDEALLAAAHDRPCFAMQDFWGDVNRTLGVAADRYFALDQLAVDLTASRHGQEALACGSPKHHRYAALDIAALRAQGRSQLQADSGMAVIGYFGQSLAHRPGYGTMLQSFARHVAALGSQVRLVYRPHPRERAAEITTTLDSFAAAGMPATLVQQGSTEQWLAAADVVVSCFSTCAYDMAFLNRFSPTPLNTAIYLLYDASVAQYFRDVTDLEVPPPAQLGLARAVLHDSALAEALAEALSPLRRQQTWQLARQRLPDPEHAARRILEEIRQHVQPISDHPKQRSLR